MRKKNAGQPEQHTRLKVATANLLRWHTTMFQPPVQSDAIISDHIGSGSPPHDNVSRRPVRRNQRKNVRCSGFYAGIPVCEEFVAKILIAVTSDNTFNEEHGTAQEVVGNAHRIGSIGRGVGRNDAEKAVLLKMRPRQKGGRWKYCNLRKRVREVTVHHESKRPAAAVGESSAHGPSSDRAKRAGAVRSQCGAIESSRPADGPQMAVEKFGAGRGETGRISQRSHFLACPRDAWA